MVKGEGKLSVADLGLTAIAPPSLAKSRQQKRFDKVAARKDKHARVAASAAVLAKGRELAEQHAAFVREEAEREAAEKRARQQELKVEHLRARHERQQRETDAEHAQLAAQSAFQAAAVEQRKVEGREQRAMAAAIAAREAERARDAPRAVHIAVARPAAIAAARASLPVLAEEQPIMEAVENSSGSCVVVCGATGSGKTTQVPQFLWEAGYGHAEGAALGRAGMIAVTEPRRVAAISMARRVAEELGVAFGGEVCYHVRYDNNLSPRCRLKFMTEGVLLKELSSDFLLRRYSAVVVDEAHERSVSCDILCGLLSRVVPLRQQLHEEDPVNCTPLRLIIMSATMRVADFRENARLFPRPPPLIDVEARRFPVSNHFSRTTELFRYVDEAAKKVKQIHKRLPPGGILVFLSTQREIESLCRSLQQHYHRTRIRYDAGEYRKHSMVPMRQRNAQAAEETAGVASSAASSADGDGNDSAAGRGGGGAGAAGEDDEFGLRADEYAMEGDEDFDQGHAAEAGGVGSSLPGSVGTRGRLSRQERRLRGARDDYDHSSGGRPAPAAARVAPRRCRRRQEEEGEEEGHLTSSGGSDDDDDDEEEEDSEHGGAAPHHELENEDEEDGSFDTLHILPLYSLLSTAEQQRVFDDPPPNKRLCVIATNVAETSITIPNIRYVVDAGREKCKTLEPGSGAAAYRIQWISQASAEQRSGRAGRTGPGHCYRLYSTAVFTNRMPKHSAPEILRTPLESVLLLMKQLRIDHVGNFPFPTPPSREATADALRHLLALRALDAATLRITRLGQRLSAFPVAPRFAHMINAVIPRLARASKRDPVATNVLAAAAVASTSLDIFAIQGGGGPGGDEHEAEGPGRGGASALEAARELHHAGSDLITCGRALALFTVSRERARDAGLVIKTMQEASQLRTQLERVVVELCSGDGSGGGNSSFAPTVAKAVAEAAADDDDEACAVDAALQDFDNNEGTAVVAELVAPGRPRTTSVELPDAAAIVRGQKRDRHALLPPLTREEEIIFRQIVAGGLIDQVARRATAVECAQRRIKYGSSKKTAKAPYLDFRTGSICFIHPTSSVARTHPAPEYVVYCALQRTRRVEGALAAEVKTFMKGVTIVTRQWLEAAGFDEDEAGAAVSSHLLEQSI